MDISVRPNVHCIIGQPKCDYYFNSSRSCFIGYGFNTSQKETDILEGILEKHNIEPVTAASTLNSGQTVFCTKICSKIITSRFCIVLVNADRRDGVNSPNANVHTEYGMMLAFNKHVIPFQKEQEGLSFNIAGLDTVKYGDRDFKQKAEKAIAEAIAKTEPAESEAGPLNHLGTYFLSKGFRFTNVEEEGANALFKQGQLLGYSLLNDFAGSKYVWAKNVGGLATARILWELDRTQELFAGLMASIQLRTDLGLAPSERREAAMFVINNMETWLIIEDAAQHRAVEEWKIRRKPSNELRIINFQELQDGLETIESGSFYDDYLLQHSLEM